MNERHGGPYDRGSADAYYGRQIKPHYFAEGTHTSLCYLEQDMTEQQIDEYLVGYASTEDRKDWG
jgi:hypothetical protein|tara:strand:- start:265 stop:459 length:195 start_codon:yes stop_codon:yes gene_type:complete